MSNGENGHDTAPPQAPQPVGGLTIVLYNNGQAQVQITPSPTPPNIASALLWIAANALSQASGPAAQPSRVVLPGPGTKIPRINH